MVHVNAVCSLNTKPPLSQSLLPCRLKQLVIELHIAVQVPLLCRGFDILLYLRSCGVEVTPVRLGVEWEGLGI